MNGGTPAFDERALFRPYVNWVVTFGISCSTRPLSDAGSATETSILTGIFGSTRLALLLVGGIGCLVFFTHRINRLSPLCFTK